jgi:benzoate/toluate 1,2-dioxygenase beta subunit
MSPLSRVAAEELLVREAYLIDSRCFREWLDLFTEDGLYWVPGDDPDLDPKRQVSIIYDDAARRKARVERLEHRSNWRDDPPGRLLHLVSNVLVDEADANSVVIQSSQLICHGRRGESRMLAASCTHHFRLVEDRWLISLKKVCLVSADEYFTPGSIVLL